MTLLDYPPRSIARFNECCRHAIVLRHSVTNELKISYTTCGSRLCPRCSIVCRRLAAEAIANSIGTIRPRVWRFLTLTLTSSKRSLSDQLSHLTASFRRLRQTQLWQSTQLKGYGIIEVSFNNATGLWHPHLHILTRGIYLPQKALSRQWLICSRGSTVTDIRALSSRARTLAYVTKYLGKAPNILHHPRATALFKEWMSAIRNRKLIIPWGARTVSYDDDLPTDSERPANKWEWVCTFSALLIHAREGMPEARSMLDQLNGRGTFAKSWSFIQDP